MTVPGEADNPAAALANAVWGMREAVALSSTALKKAEAWAASNGTGEPSGEPLELAGNEPVEQEPWQEQQGVTKGGLSYKTKFVPLGDNDYLHFESLSDSEGNDPDVESVREQYGLDYPHEVLWGRGPRTTEPFSGKFDVTGEGKAGQMISHASQALRELVDRYKPVSVEFSAHEPSRQKAYSPHDAEAGPGRHRRWRVRLSP